MALSFRIYYGDGSTFSSADGSPFDAPRLGVQSIVGVHRANGRYVVADETAYWWNAEEDRWRGGDRHGEWIYMLRLGPRVVLYGEQVDDDIYNSCVVAAQTDKDFPPRTARGRGDPVIDLSQERSEINHQ